ncbi:unnamed protein product, partial [Rhizoctonia solani]
MWHMTLVFAYNSVPQFVTVLEAPTGGRTPSSYAHGSEQLSSKTETRHCRSTNNNLKTPCPGETLVERASGFYVVRGVRSGGRSGAPRNHSKPYKVARRPFESARLDAELKLAGEYVSETIVRSGSSRLCCPRFGILLVN